jgi:hypothetical protein
VGYTTGQEQRRGEHELRRKVAELERALGRKTYELEIAGKASAGWECACASPGPAVWSPWARLTTVARVLQVSRQALYWTPSPREAWLNECETLDDARRGIGGYVERYHHRPHSGLRYRTPLEVRQTWEDLQHRDQPELSTPAGSRSTSMLRRADGSDDFGQKSNQRRTHRR